MECIQGSGTVVLWCYFPSECDTRGGRSENGMICRGANTALNTFIL